LTYFFAINLVIGEKYTSASKVIGRENSYSLKVRVSLLFGFGVRASMPPSESINGSFSKIPNLVLEIENPDVLIFSRIPNVKSTISVSVHRVASVASNLLIIQDILG